MSGVEVDDAQSAYGDGGGPGAPTPLTALEVKQRTAKSSVQKKVVNHMARVSPV